ncbi:unnamed protein product [Closterium sp. NIES-65]|nr:unnamed protein product [Closterium sp. NIES-65]
MAAEGVAMELEGQWRDLDRLLLRPGMLVGPGFEPSPEVCHPRLSKGGLPLAGGGGRRAGLRAAQTPAVIYPLLLSTPFHPFRTLPLPHANQIRDFLKNDCCVLVVGAGGLGCELLKDLIREFLKEDCRVLVVGAGGLGCELLKGLIRDFLKDDCRVLVVGAGGLGCELLKDLVLSGFGSIDVIDMDTIDVSNLNRQFLFRPADVGKPKAVVAAERVMSRVGGVQVTPHFCRIEDKPASFFSEFNIIVLGLDSLEARSYINSLVCGFLEYSPEGELDLTSIRPMVDGGTEGFKGHARVIIPGVTPCFHCTLWLFPPQTKFPLCTLAETPRSPAHCIEYAHLIQWGEERPGESFDADNLEHIQWIYHKALIRAQQHSITGVTLSLTQGVVKNIIPAIASTNAIISAVCALETLKIATMCSAGMNNYVMYVGTQGVYSHTVAYERDPECLVCSAGVPVTVPSTATLQQFIDQLLADSRFATRLQAPSVSFYGSNLYLRAPAVLEEATRPNLSKPLKELMDGVGCVNGEEGGEKKGVSAGGVLNVNDKKLAGVLRVRVSFNDEL